MQPNKALQRTGEQRGSTGFWHTGQVGSVAAQDKIEVNAVSKMGITPLLLFLHPSQWRILVLTVLFLVASYFAGSTRARQEEVFAVSSSEQRFVILRQYGDRFVAASLNSDLTLAGEFILLSTEAAGSLRLERVGPLSPLPILDA